MQPNFHHVGWQAFEQDFLPMGAWKIICAKFFAEEKHKSQQLWQKYGPAAVRHVTWLRLLSPQLIELTPKKAALDYVFIWACVVILR